MAFLAPAALLFGLIALPILALYLLKLRRRDVQVSSTLLWEQVLRDREANAPWQRLRRNLLLLLQLLILAALVFALARPAFEVPSVTTGSVVVVLDASASMNATDVPPNRFEAARRLVQGILAGLPPGDRMSLILAGANPILLANGEMDHTLLQHALEGAKPGTGPSDWPAAFALASGVAAETAAQVNGQTVDIVLVSDGGIPPGTLPPLPGRVKYLPVGQGKRNLAVRALAPRPVGSEIELFASIANYGDQVDSGLLSIYQDGVLIHSQAVSIPPGKTSDITLEHLTGPISPAGESLFEARLSTLGGNARGLDYFPLDDNAFAVFSRTAGGRALLASNSQNGNLFLEQILAALPGIQPYRLIPGTDGQIRFPDSASRPYDFYILDGVQPPSVRDANLLLVNPPDNELFKVGGVFTDTAPSRVLDGPLTKNITWKAIHIRQAYQVTLPSWAQVLVDSPGGPLVFAGEQDGRRIAVLTFDLHDSDLPLQVAYPILMANLVNYLLSPGPIDPDALAAGLQPGESLTLRPPPGVQAVTVQTPSGRVIPVEPGEGGYIFTDTQETGIYTTRYPGSANGEEHHFAVNLFSPSESDIQPAEALQTPAGPLPAIQQAEIGQRELWPWLAGLAFLVLILEWWIAHRQQELGVSEMGRIQSWLRYRIREGEAKK